MRISARLTKLYPLSRRAAKEAIFNGFVTLNGKVILKDTDCEGLLKYEEEITKPCCPVEDYLLLKNNEMLFIYKPPFMHSDRQRPTDALTISDIMEKFSGYKSISRLDYETDGVIGATKEDLKINVLKKRYLAIVSGSFPDTFSAAWSIDADNRRKVHVINDNCGNLVRMRKLRENNGLSLIEAVLEKASRHQIRAFCAHIGHPIRGDKIYGGIKFDRLCLHCESVSINEITAHSGDFGEKFTAIID